MYIIFCRRRQYVMSTYLRAYSERICTRSKYRVYLVYLKCETMYSPCRGICKYISKTRGFNHPPPPGSDASATVEFWDGARTGNIYRIHEKRSRGPFTCTCILFLEVGGLEFGCDGTLHVLYMYVELQVTICSTSLLSLPKHFSSLRVLNE